MIDGREDGTMTRILVAIDGSEHSWKALDLAIELAATRNASLLILHVIPYEPIDESLRQFAAVEHVPYEEEAALFHYARTLGDNLTSDAEKSARRAGLESVEGRTAEGRPAEQILAVAVAEQVDMIILGSRGRSDAKALFLGSVSHKVANHAPCTCVTVK
jgi:nucleotide-binding universal stress UspA family protein